MFVPAARSVPAAVMPLARKAGSCCAVLRGARGARGARTLCCQTVVDFEAQRSVCLSGLPSRTCWVYLCLVDLHCPDPVVSRGETVVAEPENAPRPGLHPGCRKRGADGEAKDGRAKTMDTWSTGLVSWKEPRQCQCEDTVHRFFEAAV